jgi:hypothetical protein
MANGWTMTLRNFLIIVAKNAVGALIVNVGAWWILPANFNFHNTAAIWNIVKMAVVTVIAAEVKVWLPSIIKWSTTNADPSALQGKLAVAEVSTQQAAKEVSKAVDAIAAAKDVAPKP